jgi:adenosylhomocysteine nucleosidase
MLNIQTILFIVAMEEEFVALKGFFNNKPQEIKPFLLYSDQIILNNKKYQLHAIISNIGKSSSASATTYAIAKCKPNIVINIGSSGGVNNAKINNIVISNITGFFDCDVVAFGYKIGQMARQPEFFVSSLSIYDNLIKNLQQNQTDVLSGTVITGDSFVNDINKVNTIKSIYPNTLAIEMEASSIALVCNTFSIPFLLVKKISDMADSKASENFTNNITNIDEILNKTIYNILLFLSKL